MKLVKRKNEVLRVNDDAVERFLKDGYDLLDDAGKNVVQMGMRETYTAAEYNAVVQENTKLKEELNSLQRKYDDLSAQKGK